MTDRPHLTRGRVVLSVVTTFAPSGRLDVPAIILGPLAVTASLEKSGGWHVTHVASGLRLDGTGDGRFATRPGAVAAMRDLVALDPDWTVSTWDYEEKRALRLVVAKILRRHAGAPVPGRALP